MGHTDSLIDTLHILKISIVINLQQFDPKTYITKLYNSFHSHLKGLVPYFNFTCVKEITFVCEAQTVLPFG